jgi:peroxiredoxin
MLLEVGCATTHTPRTGQIYGGDLKPGCPCPDFTFVNDDGAMDTFAHVRGTVTLVVFPDDPQWPDCEQCKKVVDLAGALERAETSVVVVSIRSPGAERPCSAAVLHQYRVRWQVPFIALCDHQRRAHDLFGPNALGKFFVVDPEGRIAACGSLAEDLKDMEAALREVVRGHERDVEILRVAERT